MYIVKKDDEVMFIANDIDEANDYIAIIGGNVYDYEIEYQEMAIDYEAELKQRDYLTAKITIMMTGKCKAADLEKEKQRLLICENKIRIVEEELAKKKGLAK